MDVFCEKNVYLLQQRTALATNLVKSKMSEEPSSQNFQLQKPIIKEIKITRKKENT